MSNIKIWDSMIVAFGQVLPSVLEFTARDFSGMMGIDDVEITHHRLGNCLCAVRSHDKTDIELDRLLDILNTEISHMTGAELREQLAEDDYHCANPDHILNEVECYCSLDDCMIVRVYSGQLVVDDCIIAWYYVERVE